MSDRPLKILHVFRAPVGGLFRHVMDLARGQIERGHQVGVVADSLTGGERATTALSNIAPRLALGLSRVPMRRHPGPLDLPAVIHLNKRIRDARADVVHGHGAKGGAYARLAFPARRPVRAYTPHGGSLWFEWRTLTGKFYLSSEKLLIGRGDLYLFESENSARTFQRKIGNPRAVARVVHNGVAKSEFEPVKLAPDATDILFLGELRALKGVDLLIEALAQMQNAGRRVTATLVGDGPDSAAFQALTSRHSLSGAVRFMPPMPARRAFALGRIMVVPSRAEGLPYVVLEAAAAGKPLVATNVGGIPEIYGDLAEHLVPPGNFVALSKAVAGALDEPAAAADLAQRLRERVAAAFSIDGMVEGILTAYQTALERLQARR
ncbi:MAG: glycosyltransferase family 4 protein [Pseudolabrys sp.]|nr:glycosyltransferase family 4 protein [Pseudolabrys sp.]